MNKNIEIIETEKLILEPLRLDHAQKLYNGYCDPRIYEFIECDVPESLVWLERQFAVLEKRELIKENGERLVLIDWAVYSKFDSEYIGRSEFTIYENGNCNVAYVFFSPYWRKGYAFEAMKTSYEYVQKMGLVKKFIIECDSLNVASIKMAQKLGFNYIETKFNATKLKTRIGHDHVFEKKE